MNFTEFTREQLEAALKSLRLENAALNEACSKLKRENKELKGQIKNFEGDRLDKRTVARRFSVH
jgi:septal ring factor EnvC (AmiA/AmiB activator)